MEIWMMSRGLAKLGSSIDGRLQIHMSVSGLAQAI